MKSVVTRYIGHLCPVVGHIPLLLNVIRSCLAYHTWILRNSFNSQKSNHSYKLYCKLSRINCFKYSFFNNVISYWNNLPSNVVEAGTLEFFKCKLKSFLKL